MYTYELFKKRHPTLGRDRSKRKTQHLTPGGQAPTVQAILNRAQRTPTFERHAEHIADAVSGASWQHNMSRLAQGSDATIPGYARETQPSVDTRHMGGANGHGETLPTATRAFFEHRMGADFSDVRFHHDTRAWQTAEALNAKAFTHGEDVVFNHGEYAPGTTAGNRLIAHELAHVLQQRRGTGGTDASPPTIQRQEQESGELSWSRCGPDHDSVPTSFKTTFRKKDGTEVFCVRGKRIKVTHKASWANSPYYKPNIKFQAQLRNAWNTWAGPTQNWSLSATPTTHYFNIPKSGYVYWIRFRKTQKPKRAVYVSGKIEYPATP